MSRLMIEQGFPCIYNTKVIQPLLSKIAPTQ